MRSRDSLWKAFPDLQTLDSLSPGPFARGALFAHPDDSGITSLRSSGVSAEGAGRHHSPVRQLKVPDVLSPYLHVTRGRTYCPGERLQRGAEVANSHSSGSMFHTTAAVPPFASQSLVPNVVIVSGRRASLFSWAQTSLDTDIILFIHFAVIIVFSRALRLSSWCRGRSR